MTVPPLPLRPSEVLASVAARAREHTPYTSTPYARVARARPPTHPPTHPLTHIHQHPPISPSDPPTRAARGQPPSAVATGLSSARARILPLWRAYQSSVQRSCWPCTSGAVFGGQGGGGSSIARFLQHALISTLTLNLAGPPSKVQSEGADQGFFYEIVLLSMMLNHC